MQEPLVLVVEDEPSQLEVLRYNLEAEKMRVIATTSGDEGLLLIEENLPDLVILDWMLPDTSGIEVCRRIRRRQQLRDIPIIMLTARSEETDMVRGLETGADDYVVKPYSVKELLARVRRLLRRSSPTKSGAVLQHGDIILDSEQHKVTRAGTSVKLGPKEFRLLSTFMEQPGRVWSREQLLDRVWGRDIHVDLRTVDVHVGRLRKALKTKQAPNPIRTVRSAGYALDLTG